MSETPSNLWTYERLQQLVHDQTPEELDREYKGRLAADNSKTISVSISSLANAVGGVVIFGVSEVTDSSIERKRVTSLEPIDPAKVSKEKFEDLITSNIRPKIQGLIIQTIPNPGGGVFYVVQVPQSSTVHQAHDRKYYRRRNFKSEPMDDYEIREAMNRDVHPEVTANVRFTESASGTPCLVARVENTGRRLAKRFAVSFHASQGGVKGNAIWQPNRHFADITASGSWRAVAPLPDQQQPLFPGQQIRVLVPMTPNGRAAQGTGPTLVTCMLFADEMPYKALKILFHELADEWHELKASALA